MAEAINSWKKVLKQANSDTKEYPDVEAYIAELRALSINTDLSDKEFEDAVTELQSYGSTYMVSYADLGRVVVNLLNYIDAYGAVEELKYKEEKENSNEK